MSQFALLKQRRFAPLFWTQFCNAFNDNFLKNALIILVIFREKPVLGLPSSQFVALAGGIFILPFFLFSALAGQIADRFEKAKVIRWIKGAEILIMSIATLGFLTSHVPILLVALFFMGLHSTFFGPIKYSILPQHLPLEEMVAGNALVEAGTFLAILLGIIIGGILIEWPEGPVIVSSGLMAVALTGFTACQWIPTAAAVAPSLTLQFNPWPPTKEIFHYARRSKTVFLAILGISWFWYLGAIMLSIFPTLCKDVLHGDATLVTLFLAAFSIGIGAGSMLTARLSRSGLDLRWVPVGAIGITIFSILLYFLCQLPMPDSISTAQFLSSWPGVWILGDLFLFSMSAGLFIVPLYTLMQENSRKEELSRVIAANNILNSGFMVAASIIQIALLRLGVTVPQVILIHGVINLGVLTWLNRRPEFQLQIDLRAKKLS